MSANCRAELIGDFCEKKNKKLTPNVLLTNLQNALPAQKYKESISQWRYAAHLRVVSILNQTCAVRQDNIRRDEQDV